jgi:hypothetical protein
VGRENVLLAGRAFLTASLTETCTIQHPTGPGTTNPVTGQVTPQLTTTYTNQPCKVGAINPTNDEVAASTLVTLSPTITFPVEVVGLSDQDVITITAAAFDPELVGRVYRVLGPTHRTFITRRQINVIEVAS